MGVEAEQPRGCLDDAVGVVHDDDAARAAHGAERLEPVQVCGGVQHRSGEDFGRRAARPEHLDLAPRKGAACQFVDDVPERDADFDLVVTWFLHIAAYGDHARALRFLGAALGVLGAAVTHDPGDCRQRLDIVDSRRLPPRSLDRWEGRAGARLGALSLERLEQRRLLATDVRAVTSVETNVEWVVRAKRMRSGVALL